MFESIRRLLMDLPEGKSAGWKLVVDGKEMVARAIEIASKFGVLRWGFNGAYDTWGFEEPGGGGSVLVPYFFDEDGALWIGVVRQPRPFQSETPVLNLPRGFLKPGETHFETANREGSEEVGLDGRERVFLLDGEGGNPNSTFNITVGTNEDGTPKGIRFYGVRFTEDEVEAADDSSYTFRDGVVTPVTPDAEKIMGTVFVPWTDVAQLGCMMSNAGVARLIAMAALGDLED